MKEGQTKRYDCEECNIEFELTLEPKSKGNINGKEVDVMNCPFCGSGQIVTDEDDEPEEDE